MKIEAINFMQDSQSIPCRDVFLYLWGFFDRAIGNTNKEFWMNRGFFSIERNIIMDIKTNVMRILDKKKIQYKSHCYADTDAVSGVEVARVLGQDPAQVFKTLVTVSASGAYFVFVIPVAAELDLKKAAKSVGEKSVKMLPQKELLPLTGYVHGGCSPIGMKKAFRTVLDASALAQPDIIFSAGKIGYQVELTLEELAKVLRFSTAEITVDSAPV